MKPNRLLNLLLALALLLGSVPIARTAEPPQMPDSITSTVLSLGASTSSMPSVIQENAPPLTASNSPLTFAENNDQFDDGKLFQARGVGALSPSLLPTDMTSLPTGDYYTCDYRNLFREQGISDADIQNKLDAAWHQFFESDDYENERLYYTYTVGTEEMGYILSVDSNDIRSEGMSYGMMIAVQMDRQDVFDSLWKFAEAKMKHKHKVRNGGREEVDPREGYFAWQLDATDHLTNTCVTSPTFDMSDRNFITNCVVDENPAPDGEEWLAMALFFAAGRWGNGGKINYQEAAQAILYTMLHKEDNPQHDVVTNMFNVTEKQVVFVPYDPVNPDRRAPVSFTNPSYHVPAFYELWGHWADQDNQFWYDAAATSRYLFLPSVTHPQTGLTPDYAEFDGTPTDPYGEGHNDFRFDAWRVAMNVAIDYAWFAAAPWEVEQSNRILDFFYGEDIWQGGNYGNQYTLGGIPLYGATHSPGLAAMNAVASLALTPSITTTSSITTSAFITELWKIGEHDGPPIPRGTHRYYDGMLYMLALLQASGNFRIYDPRPIEAGLRFLRCQHQQYSSGSWSNSVGITGLAALAFLNRGYDESDPDVSAAIDYIIANRQADGSIYVDGSHRTYETSIAILPLKATHNISYTTTISEAKGWLIDSQWDNDCLWGAKDPSDWYWGGFGYGNSGRPDLSNSQWALLALDAAGLPITHPTWTNAITFTSRCQNYEANDQSWAGDDGGFVYTPEGGASYGAMTAAGIWSLILSGLDATDPQVQAALDWVSNNYTWDYHPRGSASSLYYYYTSMAKALTMSRKTTISGHNWYEDLKTKLSSLQQDDGSWVGTSGHWEDMADLATAYALLALETRELPPGQDLELVIILHSPADLHLYDALGRHVGRNYDTGKVDLEIPGASYSTADPQTIMVTQPKAGSYYVELVGIGIGHYTLEIIGNQNAQRVSEAVYDSLIVTGRTQGSFLNVTAVEGALTIYSTAPDSTPVLKLPSSHFNVNSEPGTMLQAEFVVHEDSGSQGLKGVSCFASDLIGDEGHTVPAQDISFEPGLFDLAAGASQQVTVSLTLPESVPTDLYKGSITVESANAGAKRIVFNLDTRFKVYLPLLLRGFDLSVNRSPHIPSKPSPSDGAPNQNVNVDLSWTGGDPNGDSVTYDVYFEADDDTPDELVCDDATSALCDPGTLDYGRHYYWRVIATDEHGVTTAGPLPPWGFSTEEYPSLTLTSPNDGENWHVGTVHDVTWSSTGSIINVRLEYSKDDFVSDVHPITTSTLNFGIYPWTVPNDPSTTVRVRVRDADNPSTNDISDADWTIYNNPPYDPSDPSPLDGALASNQPITVTLSWIGGDPDGDDVTYDVYLEADDDTPDALICSNVSNTFCNVGGLDSGVSYYWQVVATDKHGKIRTGATWSFITPQRCRVRLNDDPTEYNTVQAAVDVSTQPIDVVKVAGYCAGVMARDSVAQTVYLSKTLTLQGGWNISFTHRNGISYPTTLNALGQGRVLYITGDVSPTIEGLRITGGNTDGRGGGLHVVAATATLSDNQVFSNTAGYGGGLYLDHSASVLSNNVIISNTATWYGGGLSLKSSDATLDSNTIIFNTARDGGGLHLFAGSEVLNSNTISSNTADSGGGLVMLGSRTALSGNTISSNTANSGGGLYLLDSYATLSNNVVAANRANSTGSGLHIEHCSLRLLQTTIACNGGGDGSGVYVTGYQWAFPNPAYLPSTVALSNTILVSHTVGISVTSGNTATLKATLWGTDTWANITDWSGGGTIITSTSAHNFWGNPAFVDPNSGDYHIGSTSAARDAGIDAGVNRDLDGQFRPMEWNPDLGADEYPGVGLDVVKQSSATFVNPGQVLTYTIIVTSAGMENADDVLLTDMLGSWQRPITALCSLGECSVADGSWGDTVVCSPGAMTVGTTARVTLTAQMSTAVTLRQVITNTVVAVADEAANNAQTTTYGQNCHVRVDDDPTEYTSVQTAVDAASPGDVVKVAGVCLGTSERHKVRQQIYLNKGLTIRGGYTTTNWVASDPATNSSTLDALGQGRVLYITGDVDPTIERLRITGGDAKGDAGGGVHIVNASAFIRDNQVFGNIADRGGGISLLLSSATISGSAVYSNRAEYGGGLYLDSSDAALRGNTISPNTATLDGGGLYLTSSDAALCGNTVIANDARHGGGAYLYHSDAMLAGNTVSSNTAFFSRKVGDLWQFTGFGGGLYLDSSDATLINNLVTENQAFGRGSGLYIEASSPRLLHTTIARNCVGCSGVYVTNSGSVFSAVALTNTILVSHAVGIDITAGNTATLEATLWGTSTWANESDWGSTGTIITGTLVYNYWGDPAFVDPGAGNYHIGPASAARDAGVNAGVTTDIDGQTRPQGTSYDIGADEYVPSSGLRYPAVTTIAPNAAHFVSRTSSHPFVGQDSERTHFLATPLRETAKSPQSSIPVTYGQTVTGTIAATGQVITYTFTGSAGDVIMIGVSEDGCCIEPEVRLYAPDGSPLGSDWTYNHVEITETLPTSGTYSFSVGDEGGLDIGAYGLYLQQLNGPVGDTTISYGQTVTGTLAHVAEMDTFAFMANTGDVILIGISEDGCCIEPEIRLYASNGSLLTSTWSYSHGEITRTLSAPGSYTLLIGDEGGLDTGAYGLYLQRLNGPAGAISINYGDTLAGSISQRAEMDAFTFAASAGDEILAVVSEDGCCIEPEIRLYAPDGSLLTSKWSYDHVEIIHTLPVSGNYALLVSDEGGLDTGAYGLALNQFTILPLPIDESREISVTSMMPLWFQIDVPSDTANLFVTLQKESSWRSELQLYDGGEVLTSDSGRADQILQLSSPVSVAYQLKVSGSGDGRLTAYTDLPELPLGQWTVGTILRKWGSAWYQLDVPPGQDSLFVYVETLGTWSQLKIYHDTIGSAPYWSASGSTMNLTITAPVSGTYYAHLTDSAWIQGDNQARDHLIKVDVTPIAPPLCTDPTITSISPATGGTAGPVTVSINGQCLDPEATICLTRQGHTDVCAETVTGDEDSRTLAATFDLSAADPGDWTLVVTHPDLQSATAPTPFTIESGGEPELWVEIIGREVIRSGRSTTYLIRYGNRGTVDAVGVPLWIAGIPTSATLDLDFDIAPPPTLEGEDPLDIDWSQLPFYDETEEEIVIPLLIWLVPAGYSNELGLTLSVPANQEFELRSWPSLPLFTPQAQLAVCLHASLAEPRVAGFLLYPSGFWDYVDLLQCVVDVANSVINVTPVFDCLSAWVVVGAEQVSEGYWQTGGEPVIGRLDELTTNAVLQCSGESIVGTPAELLADVRKFWLVTRPGSPCDKAFGLWDPVRLLIRAIGAISPEDKYGPSGYDPSGTATQALRRWIPADRPLDYRIDFWNKEDAPAATVDVIITDTLGSNLDWTTFQFTEIGFLDWQVELESTQYFNLDVQNVSIDLSPYYPGEPVVDLVVNVEGTFDPATGAIEWQFHALDPITRQPPDNPFAGFLPPITDSGWEIGWVAFTVAPKPGLSSGTVISNQAFVQFDINPFNPAPKEGPFVNTIDAVPPTSAVQMPSGTQQCSSFWVTWAGNDDQNGSGLQSFDVYVDDLEDGEPAYLWQGRTQNLSAVFRGLPEYRYGFYTRAYDNVGNAEAAPEPFNYDVEVTAGKYCLWLPLILR